jgi:hypothetical protein
VALSPASIEGEQMTTTMRAVASYSGLLIEDEHSLVDVEPPVPVAGPRDVVVAVRWTFQTPDMIQQKYLLERVAAHLPTRLFRYTKGDDGQ